MNVLLQYMGWQNQQQIAAQCMVQPLLGAKGGAPSAEIVG